MQVSWETCKDITLPSWVSYGQRQKGSAAVSADRDSKGILEELSGIYLGKAVSLCPLEPSAHYLISLGDIYCCLWRQKISVSTAVPSELLFKLNLRIIIKFTLCVEHTEQCWRGKGDQSTSCSGLFSLQIKPHVKWLIKKQPRGQLLDESIYLKLLWLLGQRVTKCPLNCLSVICMCVLM